MLIDELPVGARLNDPIFDDHGILLLDRQIELTEAFIEGLRARGIESVNVGNGVVRRTRAAAAPVSSTQGLSQVLASVAKALKATTSEETGLRRDCLESYNQETLKNVQRQFARSAELVETASQDLISGGLRNVDQLCEVAASNLLAITDDVDLVISSAAGTNVESDWNQRLRKIAVQNSVICLSIAIEMRLDLESLLHLGTASLLCDVALFQQGEGDNLVQNPLSDEYLEHPARGLDMLLAMKTVPGPVLRTVIEHHEQLDGSGFPNGLAHHQICKTARILNLAQAYVQLTMPRDGSSGYVPADAVAYLMHHTTLGKFDLDVMRAMLRTLSVYPVGSIVELTNQQRATVLRSTGSNCLKPVVQINNQVYDLRESELSIAQPVIPETSNQIRLPARLLNEVLW